MDTSTPLISVAELAAADADDCLVVDCRFDLSTPEKGHQDYRAGHVPGAVYADLNVDLSDMRKTGLGRHPLPEATDFAQVLARWGWHEGQTIVACDAGTSAMAAARLWWLLRWMGAPARVLDGGLQAWQEAGLPLETGEVTRQATRPDVRFDPEQVVYTPQLGSLLDADDVVLVDARASARYRGEQEPVDAVAGHVPGAYNRPFVNNLSTDSRWRAPQALHDEFRALIGARDPADVVHMCGSGVTACHNLLAMEHAGLRGSRLYAPSWSGWSNTPDAPVATGDA